MNEDIQYNKRIVFLVSRINFLVSHRIDLYKKLKDKNYKILIICSNEQLKEEYKELIDKKDYCHFDFRSTENNPLKIFISIWKTIKIFKKFKPNIVHTVSPIGNLVGGVAALFFKTIFLVTAISGRGTLYVNKKISTKIIKFIFSLTEYLYLNKKYSATITQNMHDFRDIEKKQIRRKNNIVLKGSGVDLLKYNIEKSNKEYDFCFVGRLTHEKGIFDFIESAKLINQNNSKIKFLVIGDMPSEDKKTCLELEAHFREKKYITYLGFQTNLNYYYKKTKILCLPSKREGMPRVVLEASACGIPSIAYDVIGCNEAIDQNTNGFLVANLDTNDFSKEMLRVLYEEDFDDLAQKARSHAEKYFSIDKVLEAHIKLYDQSHN